jgi:hypothetical protein
MEEQVKKGKLEKLDQRGLQTLFRTLSRNHYNLIKMIDNKARILLTMNSIIISVLLGASFMDASANPEVINYSSKIIFRFSVLSMLFALISMLPHKYRNKEIREIGSRGILYAGNYSNLSIEEYRKEMHRVMQTGNNIYNEMIDDLYFLGKAINIKHRLLMISFAVFIFGLVTAGIMGLVLKGNL